MELFADQTWQKKKISELEDIEKETFTNKKEGFKMKESVSYCQTFGASYLCNWSHQRKKRQKQKRYLKKTMVENFKFVEND